MHPSESHDAMHPSHAHETKSEPKTISIKLPRLQLPSLQAGILILLIVVGVLQTAQLYGLNLQIASAKVGSTGTPTTSSSSASSTDSVTSSLPNMVGGC
ncbi:MAG: hypothetical protein NUV84_03540 [Candidatus Uhrbacteria bacterium]|nr:hypothetical protein [Candidatus Uhrbacteria bacterium]